MNYCLNLGAWNGVFAVPNDIVDKYIKIASGVSVKVLLFFLRNSGKYISCDNVSESISVPVEDVNDALLFWEQVGLLAKSADEFVPAEKSDHLRSTGQITQDKSFSENNIDTTDVQVKRAIMKTAALRSPQFSPKEIADTLSSNDKVKYLFQTCEELFGRSLKHTEQNALVTIIEDIGLPAEVTLMLADYCYSINKATPAYMKSVALDWVENEITDINSAEEYIQILHARFGAESTIKNIFGLSRALSQKEKEFADTWVNKWGYNAEIITIAYDINVNAKGQANFAYIGKILENWHLKGLDSVEKILEDRQQNKKVKVDSQSSLNIDDIDNLILDKYI